MANPMKSVLNVASEAVALEVALHIGTGGL